MHFLFACLSAWTCDFMRKNKDNYNPTTYKLIYTLNWICGLVNIIIWVMEIYENL
jgi:hypothetical protein